MRDLSVIAKEMLEGADHIAKPLPYYSVYQQYFSEISEEKLSILEIGTYVGISAKIFSRFFRNSKIITIDLFTRDIDFSQFDNIVYLQADQTDETALVSICDKYAPDGFDIVIDDASHRGFFSLCSFRVLFPRLRPGGYYVVEDWGTGYWNDWPDGRQSKPARFARYSKVLKRGYPSKIITHDYGMVGFIKFLVDEVAGPDNRPSMKSAPTKRKEIEYMHLYPFLAMIRKTPGDK
jgi:SAM-dependent methyltransferase